MDQRPIGVFDSGSGGLTAVREIRSILPSENIIYFGDTSRVPYGGRSPEILLHYARQDVHFLRSFDVKALLVACGTVSTNALPVLAAESDIPILGVVEPACAAAAAATRNKKVGLIATSASVRSGAYERTLAAMDSTITVYAGACPLFVPL
ncbi:MAG TPA: glutamate racemase, partial [Oscillibacter sp.]|nr:glutamate racemase [Oscillibacter sp.]